MKIRTNALSAWLVGMTCLVLCFGSCLRPGQERAELDLQVGLASAGGVDFMVEDGLAVVRQADAGELLLWSSSPVLRVHAVPGQEATTQWRLEVRNCMPDAELVATNAEGQPVDVQAQALEGELPTRRAWALTLEPGQPVVLRIAPPDFEELSSYRIALLSDIQDHIFEVQDIFSRMNEDPQIRFVLSSGDLTEQGEMGQLLHFQREMEGLHVPLYSTTGNHEMGVGPGVWHQLWGRFNFHFVFKGVHYSLLDSGNGTLDPIVYEWLDEWLKEAGDQVHVMGTHYVPIDPAGTRNGSFRSRKEAGKLLTRLARHDVDMTFHGHIHSYYAFSLAGIPTYISGGGGAIPERLDGVGRHYLTVDVTPGAQVDQVALVRVD